MENFFRWLLAPVWAVVFGRSVATRQATLLWTLVVALEIRPVANNPPTRADTAIADTTTERDR